MTKDTFITLGIRILGCIIIVVLAVAVSVAVIELWTNGSQWFASSIMTPSLGSTIGPLLAPIAISSGVLIAILTFARDREKLAREREERRSEILLNQVREGLDEVLELLKDKNNDRMIWIRAARVLLEAISLGTQIKAPEYEKAYQLYADKMRIRLHIALTIYNERTHKREPLPPQFFYGLTDWDKAESLDNAARATSSGTQVYSLHIDCLTPESTIKPLSPSSVVAVYDFLDFPSDYSDPLYQVELWGDDWESAYGASQGARRYVAHKTTTYAVGGKLFRREKNEGET